MKTDASQTTHRALPARRRTRPTPPCSGRRRDADLRRARRRACTPGPPSSAPPAAWCCSRRPTTSRPSSPTSPPSSGRHPVLVVGGGDAARQADIVRTYAPARPHDLHPDLARAALDVRFDRLAQAGPPVARQHRGQRPQHRGVPRAAPAPTGRSPRSPSTTATACRCSPATSSAAPPSCSRTSRSPTSASGSWRRRPAPRASPACPTRSTSSTRAASRTATCPQLRYVTQAGGRMAPEQVTRYAELGRRRGWDLFVMYGQTEATARIAYLPPALAAERPASIGIPVPGGELRIDPLPGTRRRTARRARLHRAQRDDGLRRERSPTWREGPRPAELRTGDLARQADDGLFEITGRLNRCAKVFGLRVDLDRVERQLRDDGPVRAAGRPTTRPCTRSSPSHGSPARGPRPGGRGSPSVPPGAVRVHQVDEHPAAPTPGKCDYAALARHAAARTARRRRGRDLDPRPVRRRPGPHRRRRHRHVHQPGRRLALLRRGLDPAGPPPRPPAARLAAPEHRRADPHDPAAAPVHDAGGDRRAAAGGRDRDGGGHPHRPLADPWRRPRPARRGRLQPGAVHARRRRPPRAQPAGSSRTLAAVVVPASAWIAGCALVTGDYRISTAFYVNGLVGRRRLEPGLAVLVPRGAGLVLPRRGRAAGPPPRRPMAAGASVRHRDGCRRRRCCSSAISWSASRHAARRSTPSRSCSGCWRSAGPRRRPGPRGTASSSASPRSWPHSDSSATSSASSSWPAAWRCCCGPGRWRSPERWPGLRRSWPRPACGST